MSKDKQPEIRFPGFTEDWEQRKFKEFSKKTGKKNTKDLDFPAYSVSNKAGLISQTEQFDGSRLDDLEKTNYKFVEPNEFAYNPARVNVGSIAFNNLGMTVIVSSLYVVVKMSEDLDNEFILQFIKSPTFIKEVKRNTEGSVREYLFYENFANIKFPFTRNKEEQQKIGAFFKQLDDTIALQQRKLDLLKETKKGFLQKMFPKNGAKVPEIRFPGFTEDWEQRKLGEVSPLRGGFAFKSNKFVKEGIPIVRISNILSNGSVGGEFVYYTAQEKDENYLLPDKSALLAMSGATTGKVSILNNPNNNKVYQNQRVGYFTKTKNVDYSFISTLVRSKIFLDQLNSVLVAGAQPNISSKDINVFELTIPKNIEEQKKIGNFFKQLDDTIALHQRKLDLLKETKKGFLQKMFV
ncbi:restriction endonuclease subunit S [Enterococcus casseliflavus]|uniref:restriction endonuclease subunit S n=1 Tax=Enterococcus casseliflavus TaxID=37734 RepID=UPI0022E0C642|nr:restriction endonuclease subunit S [Enterococcus casseliflavus]